MNRQRLIDVVLGAAVLCSLSVVAVMEMRNSPSPSPDCSMLVNDEYLNCLGNANEVLPGCIIFLGEADNMKTLLYLGDGAERNRLTAVCVPKRPGE